MVSGSALGLLGAFSPDSAFALTHGIRSFSLLELTPELKVVGKFPSCESDAVAITSSPYRIAIACSYDGVRRFDIVHGKKEGVWEVKRRKPLKPHHLGQMEAVAFRRMAGGVTAFVTPSRYLRSIAAAADVLEEFDFYDDLKLEEEVQHVPLAVVELKSASEELQQASGL